MLRKRAWDMIREEFAKVEEGATVGDAMRALRTTMNDMPDARVVLVVGKDGGMKGAVTISELMEFTRTSVFRSDVLKSVDEAGFEDTFLQGCRICASTSLDKMGLNPPLETTASEPLVVVMERLLKKKKDVAVVCEGKRILGVVTLSDIFREISREVVATQ